MTRHYIVAGHCDAVELNHSNLTSTLIWKLKTSLNLRNMYTFKSVIKRKGTYIKIPDYWLVNKEYMEKNTYFWKNSRKCYAGNGRPSEKRRCQNWPGDWLTIPCVDQIIPRNKEFTCGQFENLLYVTKLGTQTNFIVIGNLVLSLHAGIIPMGFITI